MKNEDPHTLPISSSSPNNNKSKKEPITKNQYKFYALPAIILLAFWSMLTGTLTLNFSTANNLSHDIHSISTNTHDLDVLEMEDREKAVEHMWEVYTNSPRVDLARFWREAFVAAYEDLISDVVGVREGAVFEIAKMSVNFVDVNPPPSELMNLRELSSHGSRLQ